MNPLAVRLAALLVGMLLCSCSTDSRHAAPDTVEPGGPQQLSNSGLPDLSKLDNMRRTAEVVEDTQDGADATLQSDGAMVNGSAMQLAPAGAGFEWSIYSFATGGNTPASVDVELSLSVLMGGYIGLANYGAGHWQWYGPFAEAQTLSLAGSNFVSPGGSFYCAVVAPAGDGISVDSVTFKADHFEVGTPIVVGDDPGEDEQNQEPELAIVNGNPAATYVDFANQNVMYIRALDPQGSAWGAAQVVASFGLPGGDDSASPDLIVANGNPAIAFFDGDFNLGYVRAQDANGDTWGAPIKADATVDTGDYPSMLLVDGHPAIAYYCFSGDSVRYIRATDASGDTWGAPATAATPIGTTDFTNDCMSMTIVDGNPAIVYDHHTDETLAYVRAGDPLGADWGAPVMLDTEPRSGFLPSLRVFGGIPIVAYYHIDNGEFRMVRAQDAQGSAWDTPQVLEDGMRGASLSMELINGIPSIAHHDFDDGALLYKRADAAATSWGASVVLDDNGETGRYPSMVELAGGGPGVIYGNVDTGQLQFLSGF